MPKIEADLSKIADNAGHERLRGTSRYYADEVELLRSRAELLSGKNRVIMEMYIGNNNTCGQIAALCGLSESAVYKRIKKLKKRLLHGEYLSCLRNRKKFGEFGLKIARDYFIEGLSIEKVARKRKTTIYRVRKTIRLARSARRMERSGRGLL